VIALIEKNLSTTDVKAHTARLNGGRLARPADRPDADELRTITPYSQ
jgi:hypothetical protein